MKKILTIFFSMLFVLLAAIAFLKTRSARERSANGAGGKTLAEKERIKRFWEIYRDATAHRMAGRTPEAAAGYRDALALNGNHEDALYYFGNVCLELGDCQTAEESWQRLAQINPHSARAHLQLGNLYLRFEQKEFFNLDRAEAEFQKAQQINQEETGPMLRLGHIALIRGDLPAAQHDFDAVIATNFKSVEAHFLSGYIAWKTGNAAKASKLFIAAIKFSQADKPAKGVLSEGDTKTGRAHLAPEQAERRTLFQPYFGDLAGLDEAGAPQQMQSRYRKLQAFLERIAKISSAK
jgi:tetratricopeptide (TPR) repeat protein